MASVFLQGTPAFMAVEVQAKKHLFKGEGQAQFLHNYFHDVEGVWWIAIWHLFYACPVEGKTDLKKLAGQVRAANTIFPDDVNGTAQRHIFFTLQGDFRQVAQVLLHNKEFVDIMDGALTSLREHYSKVEHPLDNIFKHELFAGCHDALVPFFKRARDIGVEVDHYTNIAKRHRKEEEAKGISGGTHGGSATGASRSRGKRTPTDAELDTDNSNKRSRRKK
uniref:Uncharacterized protein n=1 Tax=Moniliophthora roreri TaxID=221103 RepID=A0A0W0GFC6_MONRR